MKLGIIVRVCKRVVVPVTPGIGWTVKALTVRFAYARAVNDYTLVGFRLNMLLIVVMALSSRLKCIKSKRIMLYHYCRNNCAARSAI